MATTVTVEEPKTEQPIQTDPKIEEAKQQKELESNVQEKLDSLFNPTSEDSTPDEPEAIEDDSKKSENSTPDENQADDSDSQDDSTQNADGDQQADDPDGAADDSADASTPKELAEIPAVYYRAAKHQQWTDDQISKFYQKDPELCLTTLRTLHDNMNNLSRQFAALGRERSKVAAPAAQPEKKEPAPESAVDLKRLEEAYGDDPIVDVVKALVKQNETLLKQQQPVVSVPPIDESTLRLRQQELDNTQREIDTFFADETMTPYTDFYGPKVKSWNDLPTTQFENRWAVIKMADEIIAGAASLGSSISVEEALQRAHAVVGESVREQVIRESIKKKAIARSKGISIAPTSGKSGSAQKPTTKEDLENLTAQRMAKVFKK